MYSLSLVTWLLGYLGEEVQKAHFMDQVKSLEKTWSIYLKTI